VPRRKASDILGLVGVGLVFVVLLLLVWAEGTAGWFRSPVPAVLGVWMLSVCVMALVAVSCSAARPALSATLYFIATGLGLLPLWLAGNLVASTGWATTFMLPLLLFAVAGLLVLRSAQEGRA
jgi:hypothetical protein